MKETAFSKSLGDQNINSNLGRGEEYKMGNSAKGKNGKPVGPFPKDEIGRACPTGVGSVT